ncbi:hypothetical protein LGW92_02760 [Streptococcus mutans]|nr:hypothetical protein [Streptococcus mutans]
MAHEFSSETSFIKIQKRKATHRKIGKLTKMHQHLGSLYLFAQCRSRVQFIKIQRASTSKGKIEVLTKSHKTLGETISLTQLVARVQFINVLMALLDYYSNKKKGKFHL